MSLREIQKLTGSDDRFSQTYTVLSISAIETLMTDQSCWQHVQICIMAKKNCDLKGCKI